MDLSVIIAHFNPGDHPECLESFERTLVGIHNQSQGFEVEVIVADDGSKPNAKIIELSEKTHDANGRTVYHLSGDSLKQWLTEVNLPVGSVDHWLYLPKDQQCMSKARLANSAIQVSSADQILFLDDDNYFLTQNSVSALLGLLRNYALVVGQIQDSSGRWREWSSNRVQGTTMAVKKNVIINAGGFGDWTEITSSGVDSDLWWKLYQYFKTHPELRACYTNSVQTIDSCSKRWKPFIKRFFRHRLVAKEFYKQHQCRNYRKTKLNPSRNKSLWMDNLSSSD